MGNKSSGNSGSHSSTRDGDSHKILHASEKRRLTSFLEENGRNKAEKYFNPSEIQQMWTGLLTPSLMDSYLTFLFNTTTGKKEEISLDEFINLYLRIIRGSCSRKARTVAAIIGLDGENSQLSFDALCKYLSDLMESFFVGVESRNDHSYNTWKIPENPQRITIEDVVKGVLNDLPHDGDQVTVSALEDWLHHCGLVNVLHAYVLGSLYNLVPDHEANLIPAACYPPDVSQSRRYMLLDIPHVVYLNSFLPSEHREEWRFLFSLDTHGESFSKFTASIVNQGPILIVVETEHHQTFGGYISSNLTLSPKWVGTESSFLYKLGSSVAVFPSTGYNNNFAYLNCFQTTLPNGLGMGGQYGYWGLWIDAHFGDGECSESCSTYKNYKMLNTKKKFRIKHLEVWGVGERPLTEEERGERPTAKTNRSALDQDSTATALMEMSGKEMHSKTIRADMKKKIDPNEN